MVLNWLWIDGDVDAGITGPCLNWTLGEMPPCFEFYFKGHQLQVRQSKTRQQHCCCWWTTLELTRWYPCSLPCGAVPWHYWADCTERTPNTALDGVIWLLLLAVVALWTARCNFTVNFQHLSVLFGSLLVNVLNLHLIVVEVRSIRTMNKIVKSLIKSIK